MKTKTFTCARCRQPYQILDGRPLHSIRGLVIYEHQATHAPVLQLDDRFEVTIEATRQLGLRVCYVHEPERCTVVVPFEGGPLKIAATDAPAPDFGEPRDVAADRLSLPARMSPLQRALYADMVEGWRSR